MRLFIYISLSIFTLANNALAETSYKASDLISLAIKRNPELRALHLEAEASQANARQMGKWEDPILEIGADQKDQPGGITKFGRIGLSQTIPRPGRLGAKRDAAEAEAAIKNTTQEFSQTEYRAEVLKLIYRYKVAFEKSHHAKERYDRLKTVETFLRSRPFAAPQKRAEAVIVRSKLIVLQKELQELEASRVITWHELNLYLGLSAEPSIEAPWYYEAPALNLADLEKKAETHSPELRRQTLQVSHSESESKLARYESWPGLSLKAGYADGTGYDPEKDYSLGVSFSLPLWNANRGAIQSAELKSSAEKERLSWARERVSQHLKSALEMYRAVSKSLKNLSPETIPAMERDMASIDSGFKKAQVDLITYLESDTQHAASLNAIFDNQNDFLNAFAQVLIIVGEAPQVMEK